MFVPGCLKNPTQFVTYTGHASASWCSNQAAKIKPADATSPASAAMTTDSLTYHPPMVSSRPVPDLVGRLNHPLREVQVVGDRNLGWLLECGERA